METITFSNGIEVVNVTPYDIQFIDDGKTVVVPVSGVVLYAEEQEQQIDEYTEREIYVGTPEGWENIRRIRAKHPKAYIIGTKKAAEAYSGEVVYAKPLTGYTRNTPEARRMDPKMYRVG